MHAHTYVCACVYESFVTKGKDRALPRKVLLGVVTSKEKRDKRVKTGSVQFL